ncbi:MAG: hypothetical protein OXH86_00585 [Acidimicrobiaceae bacterium]|nr:hypothetical protein [Acidimicrobiaceae bacterium]MDE0319406.1 hypothetical protein [Acidimicrobiaceae bacterium]MDE0495824.1 hypothetical protein [Acidimicrobiaceae bacterium]
MNVSALFAAFALCAGVALVAVGLRAKSMGGGRLRDGGSAVQGLMANIKENEGQNLRLAGVKPDVFGLQMIAGVVGGLVVGVVLSVLTGRSPLTAVLLTGVLCALGWFLPILGVRDTAKKARVEFDQVVRVWIVLVAQQVTAGADPSVAMLRAARSGSRVSWGLLHRFLLTAQQQRRPMWEGLSDLVESYGIASLAPVVSTLGLASERGTRISEAVLAAAKAMWQETTAQERESAVRRAQIIMVPATGVALGLAGILVYPPFTSLTGGGISPVGP